MHIDVKWVGRRSFLFLAVCSDFVFIGSELCAAPGGTPPPTRNPAPSCLAGPCLRRVRRRGVADDGDADGGLDHVEVEDGFFLNNFSN